MTRRAAGLVWGAFVLGALISSSFCQAATVERPDSTRHLVALAAPRFPNLTRAERALLEFADRSNLARGEFAIAGTSAAPLDPSNDPKNAIEWPHDRDVRAELVRWMAVDDNASARVDPNGVRLLGAKIVGSINLEHVRVPFAIGLIRCSIGEKMRLHSAEVPALDLSGSYTGAIDARNLTVHGDLDLSSVTFRLEASGEVVEPYQGAHRGEFNASGVVVLQYANIQGWANFNGGHFHYPENAPALAKPLALALVMPNATVGGDIDLGFGFESHGATLVDESVVGGDLNVNGGRFINPGNRALSAGSCDIKGYVILGPDPNGFSEEGFEADGIVVFAGAHVANTFLVDRAKFSGRPGELHGLFASTLIVQGPFVWLNVELDRGAILDLSGAKLGPLLDQEASWPAPGMLLLDGMTYSSVGGSSVYDASWKSPGDATSRLKWLKLQPGFHPQPYQQLAKVMQESGDDAGAVQVRIAADDLRYLHYGIVGRIWGAFLRETIGYGHQPLRAIVWSLLVVLVGWFVISIGKRAGIMRLTWPENSPLPTGDPNLGLHPLLYSLDVFLPFVNLHQEHYWWPDEAASGEYAVFGRRILIRGSILRDYLWLQIIAGWLLSAIFIAGVTGLIRTD